MRIFLSLTKPSKSLVTSKESFCKEFMIIAKFVLEWYIKVKTYGQIIENSGLKLCPVILEIVTSDDSPEKDLYLKHK